MRKSLSLIKFKDVFTHYFNTVIKRPAAMSVWCVGAGWFSTLGHPPCLKLTDHLLSITSVEMSDDGSESEGGSRLMSSTH